MYILRRDDNVYAAYAMRYQMRVADDDACCCAAYMLRVTTVLMCVDMCCFTRDDDDVVVYVAHGATVMYIYICCA